MNSIEVCILIVWIRLMISNSHLSDNLCKHFFVVPGRRTGSQLMMVMNNLVVGFLHDIFLGFYMAAIALSCRLLSSLIPFQIWPLQYMIVLNSKALYYLGRLIFAKNTLPWNVLLSCIIWLTKTLFFGVWLSVTGKFRHEFWGLLLLFLQLFGFADDLKWLLSRRLMLVGIYYPIFRCLLQKLVHLLPYLLLLSASWLEWFRFMLFHFNLSSFWP